MKGEGSRDNGMKESRKEGRKNGWMKLSNTVSCESLIIRSVFFFQMSNWKSDVE
jgi:hypothetical protein